jgi:hypothetical protein
MFYAVYKSVSSPVEFYSEPRETCDFPTQVEYNGGRYSLIKTIVVSSPSINNRLMETIKKIGIEYNVKVN